MRAKSLAFAMTVVVISGWLDIVKLFALTWIML